MLIDYEGLAKIVRRKSYYERKIKLVLSFISVVVLSPIVVVKVALLLCVACVIAFVAYAFHFHALPQIHEEIRAVSAGERTGGSRLTIGGGSRQTGLILENSATRSRESRRDDDLRRRLKKLRSTGTGSPARRSPITGGQYGKQ